MPATFALSQPAVALPRRLSPRCKCHMSLAAARAGPVAALVLRRGGGSLLAAAAASPRLQRRAARQGSVGVVAMVNVDISPSVVLGVGLIGAGVSLWQIRRVKPWLSKDYDVVVSCISLLVGGILIFQGWRLDPLLLFGQLMTTGAAVSFAIEALRLRSEVYEGEEKAALQDVFRRKGGPEGDGPAGSAFQLPPPEAAQQQPWSAAAGQQQQQPWSQDQAWVPAGTPGQQQQQQGMDAGPYGYGQQQQGWGQVPPPPQQPQQQWDYPAGGAFQPAEYQAYDGQAAGGDFFAVDGSDGSGAASPSSSAGPPSEFVFPAAYEEPGQADGSGWGGAGEQQQQQWGQQQAPPGGAAPRRGSSFDGMDDW